jgi:outer membrane protein TolC
MRALVVFLLLSISGFCATLSLEDVVRMATERHLRVVQSELELKKIEERIREVRGGVFPALTFSAQYIRWDPNYISAFIPENQYLITLSLNQEVFNRSLFMALKVAKRSRELQEAIIDDVRKSLEAEAKKLYWGVLLRKEVLKVKEESFEYWRRYFELVKEKYEKGIVPRFEFLRARAQLRTSSSELMRARSEFRKALNSLRSFLGIEGDVEVSGELTPLEFSLSDPFELLERNNSTLKVLRKTIRARESVVDLRKADYFPKLRAFANYEARNIIDFEAGRLVEETRSGYSLGLRLDFVIFEGFKRGARTAQERMEVLKAVEELRFTRKRLRAELDSLLSELQSLREELLAADDALAAAEESMRFAAERYRAGVGSQIDLLNARTSYERALLNRLTLIFTLNSLVADIERLIF